MAPPNLVALKKGHQRFGEAFRCVAGHQMAGGRRRGDEQLRPQPFQALDLLIRDDGSPAPHEHERKGEAANSLAEVTGSSKNLADERRGRHSPRGLVQVGMNPLRIRIRYDVHKHHTGGGDLALARSERQHGSEAAERGTDDDGAPGSHGQERPKIRRECAYRLVSGSPAFTMAPLIQRDRGEPGRRQALGNRPPDLAPLAPGMQEDHLGTARHMISDKSDA